MEDKDNSKGLDIAKTLQGNEDEVTKALSGATAGELAALHAAENDTKSEDAKKRKGVSEAIEAEQQARIELSNAQTAQAIEAADHAGVPLFVFSDRKDFEEPGEAEQLRLRVKELEEAIETQSETHENTVKDLEAKLAKKPKAPRKAAPQQENLPRSVEVSKDAMPRLASLAFADANGNTLRGLPDMDAQQRFLKRERNGMAYQGQITFPEGTGTGQQLSRIFALDATGKAIAECRLVTPLTVLSAGEALLPAGSVFFADWPKAAD